MLANDKKFMGTISFVRLNGLKKTRIGGGNDVGEFISAKNVNTYRDI